MKAEPGYRLLVVLMLLVAAGCMPETETQQAVGLLEADQVNISAESSEPITALLVSEGDRVERGTTLVEQDDARALLAVEAAAADLDLARARLAESRSGPRAQDIEAARARLAAAESDVHTSRIELEREQSLVTQNYASQNQVDLLQGRFEGALARQHEAEALLAELLEGTRSETIDAAYAQVKLAEARLAEARLAVTRTVSVAPVGGRIESLPLEVGERPQPGVPVAVINAEDDVYARVHIPANLRNQLFQGDVAMVHIDTHPEPFKGRIRWIARDASFTPYYALTQHDREHLSYVAEILLLETPDIAVGVPVVVTFPGND